MPGPVAPFPCPQCGGKCWDNRNDPTRKPSQPLVKCKNKDGCGWAVWDADKLPAGAKAQAQVGPGAQAPRPLRPPPVLDRLMGACIDSAVQLADKFVDGETKGLDHDLLLKLATTIFIARADGKGILDAERIALKERAQKAAQLAAEAKRQEEEAARKREEEERARQASQPQVGPGASGSYGDWPPLADQDELGMDDLPF